MLEQVFFDGVLVEPGDGAQAAGDGGPGAAAGFQIAGEAPDVGAVRLEQAQVMLGTPARVLTQVQCVRLAGQAAVAGQKPCQGEPLQFGKHRLGGGDSRGCGRGSHGDLPGRAEAREGWACRGPSDDASPHR